MDEDDHHPIGKTSYAPRYPVYHFAREPVCGIQTIGTGHSVANPIQDVPALPNSDSEAGEDRRVGTNSGGQQ